MLENYIFTDESICLGCNKCILTCPTEANDAKLNNLKNKVFINGERCINCGKCMDICDHNARSYEDDTQKFFRDLASGEQISIVVAPAARTNFSMLDRLFGYLKQKGVRLIYDVSFGADICTWGYLKAIQEKSLKTVIAQPCPVIVNYIEHFQPALIKYLSPVQSPALCTAIYLNQYCNNSDKVAFLSPCIAKSCEFRDPNSGGYIHYNVTYHALLEYLKEHRVNLMDYPAYGFDHMEGSFGFAFSRPGGLKENVYFYLGEDVWVTQVEGMDEVKHYFEEYENEIRQGKKVPLLVDVLNCSHGCNLGTGTSKEITRNQIDSITNSSKSKVDKEKAKELFHQFDTRLNLTHFLRSYSNKSADIQAYQDKSLEDVFSILGKETEEERNINCFCCGYGSCRSFALAIANGHNHPDNCVHYLETSLARNLIEFDNKFNGLSDNLSTMKAQLKELNLASKSLQDISLQTKLISINASIESAHAGNAGRGFALVAKEMKRLAEISSDAISKKTDDTTRIIHDIEKIDQFIEDIRKELHHVMRSL